VETVWVFNGGGGFPAAVFSTREKAEEWIASRRLSGILTEYPLDVSLYDWAITNGTFKPKRPEHSEPQFIGRFSSAHTDHYHYEDGVG
jgi:hypothetical protein